MSIWPQAPPLITPSEVATWVLLVLRFMLPQSATCVKPAEEVMQEKLERMDRKKKESPEAYLRMLHSETLTLKFVLSRREEMPAWRSKHYERKAVVLESKLNAWIQEEDTAPVP